MEFKKAEKKKFLECAKIVNTHGIRGAVKLENYTDAPETLARLHVVYMKRGEEYEPYRVLGASVQKSMVIMTLEGIDSVEAAVALKNRLLYADRGDFRLRGGDYFIADIIGLSVFDSDSGAEYGTLREVLSPAGQQVYVVEKANGKSFMIPCVAEFIKKVSFGEDCDAGVYVKLIEGMDDCEI